METAPRHNPRPHMMCVTSLDIIHVIDTLMMYPYHHACDVVGLDLRLRNVWEKGDPMHDRDEPFGGFDIFLCGDFRQLPPVKARAMYRSTARRRLASLKLSAQVKEMLRKGRAAYRTINRVITLKKNMRQRDVNDGTTDASKLARRHKRNAAHRRHLERMGNGACRPALSTT